MATGELTMRMSSKDGGGAYLLLAFALVAWAVATAHLMLLLWRFVPGQAAAFEGMGAVPPLGLSIAIAASNWMVRLFPFAVLASPFVLGGLAVVGGLVAWRMDMTTRAVVRALIVVALAGLSVTVLASFGIVHSADLGLDRRLEQIEQFERR
jgi:hypothetical protein